LGHYPDFSRYQSEEASLRRCAPTSRPDETVTGASVVGPITIGVPLRFKPQAVRGGRGRRTRNAAESGGLILIAEPALIRRVESRLAG
jgi:hypothetical protein